MRISPKTFTRYLLEWHEANPRDLPWKRTRNPYHIWISEVILQQTRVAQGILYYKEFLRKFPTVRKLAAAPEKDVLRAWQGLGYNSRARNLHAAAKTIVKTHHGKFPRTYPEIRALKGIGDYTASAIASFAFDLQTPVLDTNVIRLLTRVYGIADDPAATQTKKLLYNHLKHMIVGADAATFNQAIMNFGAMQCVARNPDCAQCIFRSACIAHKEGLTAELPFRKEKKARRQRYFNYFIIRKGSQFLVHHRQMKDIWQQMYEFPLLETQTRAKPSNSHLQRYVHSITGNNKNIIRRVGTLSQVLTHQEIHCTFYTVSKPSSGTTDNGFQFITFAGLDRLPLPKVIRTFITNNSLLLSKLQQGQDHDQ